MASKFVKTVYTEFEIEQLHILITERRSASPSDQKKIRNTMRKTYGFYGKDHWGIVDLDHHHLDSLIATRQIVIKSIDTIDKILPNVKVQSKSTAIEINIENAPLKELLSTFTKLVPSVDEMTTLPRHSGNYIICLNSGCSLPKTSPIPHYTPFQGLDVIYTGLSKNLYGRDYKQHFENNDASWSTLRKSIGVLFKYQFVPRISKKNPTKDTGKWKFSDADEKSLSNWMKKNLVLFYLPNGSYKELECRLIEYFDPPLNLSMAFGYNNLFRAFLKELRICSKDIKCLVNS